ncbi:MAG TPA: Uma2 family endonuclease [Longimicrobiaceae bacterium]|nr:Uma2 family endonuclease [Longimicrobiaceae bacterium]
MATRLESVHRFTVDEYYRMAELGILPDGPMELIEGRVLIGGRPWRFSTEDYRRLAEVGILSEDDHVELIEGEIIEMSPKGSRHSGTLKRLVAYFSERLGKAVVLSVQDPLDLGDGTQPEPDFMLLRRRPDFYTEAHPKPADVLLLIEVADTSLAIDRTRKADLYAAAGIPEYWVVDIERRRIFVHTGAMPTGYAKAETRDADDTLNVQQLDGFPVSGNDIFG